MAKLCGKCGYERKDTDQAPITECPRCGVIYARIQPPGAAAMQKQQLRLASMVRRNRALETDRSTAGVFTFGWMLTPLLVKAGFVIALVLSTWAFVSAMISGNGKLAVAVIVSLFVTRILLEAVMVMFRIADDLGEVRLLLAAQSVESLRKRGTP